MLRKISEIQGYSIKATDGLVGTVVDFLFEDTSWAIRWVVVDTGNWLSSRKILLPTSALGHGDSIGALFSVRLTMQQVKDGPDIDLHRPVSRQVEDGIYDYYGWTPYWGAGFFTGAFDYPVSVLPPPLLREDAREVSDDLHLRSTVAVNGYHIKATDGEIGHVEDFLVEDADWSVHYLIVDTKNWWPAKRVLIAPRSASKIDWPERLVTLTVDRQHVKDSPAYDSSTTMDHAFENQFHSHYGHVRS